MLIRRSREAGRASFSTFQGSRKQGTAGCTAMSQNQLETLLTWLDPTRKPLLVQLPALGYARLAHSWGLPAVVGAAQH